MRTASLVTQNRIAMLFHIEKSVIRPLPAKTAVSVCIITDNGIDWTVFAQHQLSSAVYRIKEGGIHRISFLKAPFDCDTVL